MDPARLAELQQRLAYRFRDADLLARALTHSSYANEHPSLDHNEALAFVGDAALSLVVAERLCADDPAAPVGVLTPRRAELVSGAALAHWATALDVGGLVRLGRGEAATGGATRESILATTLEALLGAMYVEAGLDPVRRAVAHLASW